MKKPALKLLVAVIILAAVLLIALPFWASAETVAPAADLVTVLTPYVVLPVAVVCFAVGWMLKNIWGNFNTKLIPVVLLPIGVIGVLWMRGWSFTPENAFAGFSSAAIAVYLHATGKHISELLKPPEQ